MLTPELTSGKMGNHVIALDKCRAYRIGLEKAIPGLKKGSKLARAARKAVEALKEGGF